MDFLKHSAAIWSSDQPERPDQYRVFRKKFRLPQLAGREIRLALAADSTYSVWINGIRLPGAQQLADFPGDRTFSELDVTAFVHAGDNVIAAEVHYIGKDFFTSLRGRAFLRAAVHDGTELFAATDRSWKWRVSPDMVSGLGCPVTMQLGFVFCCDARKSEPWQDLEWDDSAWQDAVELTGTDSWNLTPRPVPQLTELPRQDVFFAQGGWLKRSGEKETFARTAFQDFLAPKRVKEFFLVEAGSAPEVPFWTRLRFPGSGASEYTVRPAGPEQGVDGYYLIVDLGRESVGYLDLDLSAPEGTVIDICHGEHLEDGRVRCTVDDRNFADRLICREGRNELLYVHRRIGCRYLELHITHAGAGPVCIRYAGLTGVELPLAEESEFHSEDRLLARIGRVSADTLKLCMHEHYEDCPWREQALYAYDSRNQMLYGYYLWGNYDFAAASLDLLGKSFDGRYLALTAPGRYRQTIPLFTFVWIAALYEHFLHSGSPRTLEKWLGQADRILDRALSEPVERFPGLYHPGTGKEIWNFCEWNGQLSSLDVQPQLPYNVYLHEALSAAAKMHRAAGDPERAAQLEQTAEKLGRSLERVFFNVGKGYYEAAAGTPAIPPEGYEHIQAVMLAAQLVPEGKKDRLLEWFRSGKLVGIDLSALVYLIRGMTELGPEGRRLLLDYLRRLLEPQILSGATSLWETRHSGNHFDNAGSLCHGWSCVMPYYCRHVLLGVTPLEGGFRRFEVKPYSGGYSRAGGTVPTPQGPIRVSWDRAPDGLHVQVVHPRGLELCPAQWPEVPVRDWKIGTC